MYKVIIIDDEENIREGLKTIIDWHKYGFEICQEADNGIEGFEKIKLCDPDLAIIDIRMPLMDGLSLIKEAKKQQLKCRFIILSGYSEFDYAQKALNYGSKAYILKPIDAKELEQQVKLMMLELNQERKGISHQPKNIHVAASELFEAFLSDGMNSGLVKEYNDTYGFELPWDRYKLVLINVSRFDSVLRSKIFEIINGRIVSGPNALIFRLGLYHGFIIRNYEPNDAFEKTLYSLQRVIARIADGICVVIFASEAFSDQSDIQTSFKRLKELADNYFLYCSLPKVINNQTAQIKGSINLKNMYSEILNSIMTGAAKNLSDTLDAILESFILLNYNENKIKLAYIELITMVNEELEKKHFIPNKRLDNSIITLINERQDLKSLDELVRENIKKTANEVRMIQPYGIADRITDYIQKNCRDANLTLRDIAGKFGYNPNYLGALISSHIGMSFNKYLEHVRIEYAKELLSNGIKATDVAMMAGFNDYIYFYKKFKSKTGYSPLSLKKKKQ